MKKVIVLIVLAAAFILLMVNRRGPEIPYADVFPRGAIAYVGVNDGAALVRDILGSQAWKELSGVGTVRKGIETSRVKLEHRGSPVASARAIGTLLGEKAAVALYGKESHFGLSLLGAVESREMQERILARLRSGLGATPTGSYGGMDIYAFTLPSQAGLEGVYARRGSLGMVAISRSKSLDLLRQAIDLRQGKTKGALSGDSMFIAGCGKPLRGKGNPSCCVYINAMAMEKDFASLKRLAEVLGKGGTVARLGGVQSAVVSCGGYLYRDKGIVGTIRTRVDPRQITAVKASTMSVLRRVPRGSVALVASRVGDPRAAWRWWNAMWPGALGPEQMEKKFGIDVEKEIIPWVGDEMAFYLGNVQAGGLFPIVQAGLIVATRDPAATEQSLTRIMKGIAGPAAPSGQQGAWAFLKPQIITSEHGGKKITTLKYPIPGFSPSFACSGDYVFAGLDRTSVEGAINADAGQGDSILGDATFSELRAMAPRRLTQLSYLDCGRALEIGEGVAKWLIAIRKLTLPPEEIEKAERLARIEAELPRVLSSLKVFRVALSAASQQGDAIDQVYAIRTAD